jgi:general secretion pathway protein K
MVMPCNRGDRDRGFALLIVLWTLGLLALLGTMLTAAGRVEIRIAANARDAMVAETAADGGLQQAVFLLMQGNWAPDGTVHTLHVGQAVVEVSALDQSGKLNPNTSTTAMLQALLVNLGIDTTRAAPLARAIIDWRIRGLLSISGGTKLEQYRAAGLPYTSANRLFESIDEIGLVRGMTPALLARLAPFVSIYQEGDVQQSVAGSIGNAALDDARMIDRSAGQSGFVSRNMVAVIDVASVMRGGTRFTRRAAVRFKAEPQAHEVPFQILTWESPHG